MKILKVFYYQKILESKIPKSLIVANFNALSSMVINYVLTKIK